MQNLYIHSISGIGRKPVKKIPAYATLLLTMKPEVESPLNRICISYNRRGHRAFAVFLLSFFIRLCRRAVSGIHCRSPPSPSGFLHFQKFRWEVLTVKYAPRKVYIKENDGYMELSYMDFCHRRQADQSYMDKLFIPCLLYTSKCVEMWYLFRCLSASFRRRTFPAQSGQYFPRFDLGRN